MIKKCLFLFLLLLAVGSVSAVPDYTINETDFENPGYTWFTYHAFVIITEPGEYTVTADFVNNSLINDNIVILIKDTENVTLNCNDKWFNTTTIGSINYPVYVYNSSNITVKNLKCNWSTDAIVFDNVENSSIENSNIISKGLSIYLGNSYEITISGNTLNSTSRGMRLDGSQNNMISECDIYSIDGYTLTLTDSENNIISGCNVTTPDYFGIDIENSDNTSIINSTASAASKAIYLDSNNCTIMGSNLRAYEYSGLRSYNKIGNNIINCTVYAPYDALDLSGSDNNVTNCTLTGNHEVVSLSGSDNNIIGSTMRATTYDALTVGGTYQNIINCTLTAQNNTFYVNGQNIEITGSNINSNDVAVRCILASYWNRLYLNNINGSINNQGSSNYFTSDTELNYTYAGKNYTGILGNYWYLYDEEDAVIENGTWSIPYVINAYINDSKPLAGPWDRDTNSIFGKIEYDDGKIHLTQADFVTGLYIINESGTYVLEENISNGASILINSSNVTFDGNGFYLIHNSSSDGLIILEDSLYENITIKNVGLINWSYAMSLYNTHDIIVSNCTFLNNNYGITADSLYNGTVTGCTFESCETVGIEFNDDVENMTVIYNEFVGNDWGIAIFGINNWVYLNNFENNSYGNVYYISVFGNYFHSPIVNYKYNGKVYEGRLGNYYDGEELGTSNAGIFNKPYGIEGMIPK
ncbi:parallel beta-helix repeat protein [Methanococcus maripaludis]|uniref:Parallel beta-helix repeat protein n=1 Tax=Methanococcus maripaludis TaxID=39152 RepID=A0A7J9P027_METMI|nr:NosD domain-containing protein [Methanococcus maripaludis]MBA2853289.1 parallel beta-helix repeat protein [Methanococcus maripaludis]